MTLAGETGAGTGAGQLERILRELALLPLHGDPEDEQAPAHDEETLFKVRPGDHCLLISASRKPPALAAGVLVDTLEA